MFCALHKEVGGLSTALEQFTGQPPPPHLCMLNQQIPVIQNTNPLECSPTVAGVALGVSQAQGHGMPCPLDYTEMQNSHWPLSRP